MARSPSSRFRNEPLPLDFGALEAPRMPVPPVMVGSIVPESPSRGGPVTTPVAMRYLHAKPGVSTCAHIRQ